MLNAIKVIVKGRVQGVGFRPFIFSLADQYGIKGTVQNNMDGVRIHAEASEEALAMFTDAIRTRPPRLSKIDYVTTEIADCQGFSAFTIIPSDDSGKVSSLVIPIDAAVCEDCLAEMNDPSNFRYRYPFINCTQCGPRYTIISSLPYDRPVTSMKAFAMCPMCAREYNDPVNRRHHAQPIACPTCGPALQLFSIDGEEQQVDDALLFTRRLLLEGKIVAIKGLGGYHLCCDAKNSVAVARLRKRKNRPMRPLAIMAKSVQAVKQVATISNYEENILASPEAPIVLLQKKEGQVKLAVDIAPSTRKIGVMLAYTPLHHLLLDEEELPYVVATSANPSGLPILYQDEQAFTYLEGIADFVLMHNRVILHPIDDSVVECCDTTLSLIRRARGFAPDPLPAPLTVDGIVAFGGQMKNTFAIGRGEQIIVGPHIGEMGTLEMEAHFTNELTHLLKWTSVSRQVAVIDQHPSYATRRLADHFGFDRVVEVQHHHAHMAGCMAENAIDEECYGIILDGTGYGLDGNIWGFEVFQGTGSAFTRIGHLQYTPLPGGDKAVLEPWRNAAGMLIALLPNGVQVAKEVFPDRSAQIDILTQMVKQRVNAPLAGTCGRLYDAVSAILGICDKSTYDGEAAIRLSELAIETKDSYPFCWQDDVLYIDEMITAILQDKMNHVLPEVIAGKFQRTIVESLVARMVSLPRKKVVCSGGSFHNQYLLKQVIIELQANGFEVFHHHKVPTGDGGLSYGQLIVAAALNIRTE